MFERLKHWLRTARAGTHKGLMPESEVSVRVDDDGLAIASREGHVLRVGWQEVCRVVIETNDSGPWGADVWWVFETSDARYRYPQGATGEDQAMNAFRDKLPGFDWEAVIKAQGSTDNARFVCWERRSE